MCAWALDDGEIDVWVPQLGPPPTKFIDALATPNILKIAWNSSFEYNITRYVLPRYLKIPEFYVPLDRWRDPIILAHHLSLPGKLEDVAKILQMKELKDPRGEKLVKMFSKPVSLGGEQTLFGIAPPLFRDQKSHPKEFAEYIEYCRQDIRAERGLWYRMNMIPLPEIEWRGWLLDQKINEFGMPGNRQMAEKMLRIAERYVREQREWLKIKTKLENPNSDSQMKEWVVARGYSFNSLNAKYVQLELENPESKLTPEAREVLEVRAKVRRSSYKKLTRFLSMLSSDDRLRWQFKYMAAARTGRWSSGKTDNTDSSVQVQNMSRGEKAVKKQLQRALALVMNEDYDGILREFTNVPDKKKSITPVALVITLLRSLFQAKAGKKLVVADLNAIETRKLAWASGCKDMLDIFTKTKEEGGDPYLAFGMRLYSKSYAEMWAAYMAGDETERQNSKPAMLGAGYGLGGGELYRNEFGDMVRGGLWGYAKNVCGVDMPKELAHKAVEVYRRIYPEVVHFWFDLEEAFKQVLKRGGIVRVGEVTWDEKQKIWVEHPTKGTQCVIEFQRVAMENGGWMIRMVLPSGRALHYLNATIELEKRQSKKTGRPYTVEVIYYDGIEHSATEDSSGTRAKKQMKWGRVKTYGGKICENAIQAMSRDDLLNGMFEADDMGFHIWGLFHDELATEEDDIMFGLTVHDLVDCMSVIPKWAPKFLLGAEGFEDYVYHK